MNNTYILIEDFFKSFKSFRHFKNKKKWNISGLSKFLTNELEQIVVTDKKFDHFGWSNIFSSEENEIIRLLGSYFFREFKKSNRNLDFLINNFIDNNGLCISSENHSFFSNTAVGENIFLFSDEKTGLDFLISFSSPWKYGFIAMQVTILSTKKVVNYTFNDTDTRISDQVAIDIGKVFDRYLTGQLEYLKKNVTDKKVIVTNYNYPHIGHNIWNGLSAWGCISDNLLSRVNTISQSLCYDFEYRDIPFEVERKFDSFDLENELPVFIKSDYIPEKVSNAIVEPSKFLLDKAMKKFKLPKSVLNKKIILINLRVGNRTIENNLDFHSKLIKKLVNNTDCILVLDGMNTSSVTEESSHKGINIVNEVELAEQLKEINPETIFSIVGSTIAENIAIANLAKVVMAPWGAGLAKYSWICHLDIVVYSSKSVLSSKPDLNIYSDKQFFDFNNDVVFLSHKNVEDIPRQGVHPSRWNFKFDLQGEEFIYQHLVKKLNTKIITVNNSYARAGLNFIFEIHPKSKVDLEILSWQHSEECLLNEIIGSDIRQYIKNSKKYIFNSVGGDFLSTCEKLKLNKSLFISSSTLYLTSYKNFRLGVLFSSGFNRLVGFIIHSHSGFRLYLDNPDFNNQSLMKRIEQDFNKEQALDIEYQLIHEYLTSEKRLKQALVLTHWHIGHHLWNELSALQEIFESGNWNKDWTLIKKTPRSEHFGLTRDLFGNKGSNEVTLNEDECINEIIIKNGLCAFVPIARFINSNLRKKILEYSHSQTLVLEQLINRDKEHVIILFNIRLGDRELINQEQLIVSLSKSLTEKGKKHTIFIDGMNNNRGATGASVANKNALQDEKLFVKRILKALPDCCISMLGCSVFESICICDLADFYIAPWGAGLAKYAWLTNTKGYVHGSNFLMNNKKDLNIYNDSKFREGAREIIYLSGVSDEESLHADPFRKNYTINVNSAVNKILEGEK